MDWAPCALSSAAEGDAIMAANKTKSSTVKDKKSSAKAKARAGAKPSLPALARMLDRAAISATAMPQLSIAARLDLEQAYEIQRLAIYERILRGARRSGVKMGFTSRAKMVQMGISDMIWGRLTSDMIVEEGGVINFASYVHPRVEPEIAFLLKKEIAGDMTPMQAMDAVEAMAPALEIIDSRYDNFKFSLEDVVADNASSSGFVTGSWSRPDIDCSNLGLVMRFNGAPVQIGSTAAILGHPARALAAAARFAAEAGEPLQPGWIVMAGGATAAEALAPDTHVEMEMEKIGRVAFTIAG
jgi:2-oxo-3-hexenedioate decarboxylase